MNTVWKDAAIRALRTFGQAFLGVILATWVGGSMVTLIDVSLLDKAAAAGVIAVLSLVMNLLEGAASVSYDKG